MNTKSVIAQLSFGELSNLSMSNDGDGTIRNQDMGRVITFINDGLVDLSNKFRSKEATVHIELFEHITNYRLNSAYALSNTEVSDVKEKYILDNTREPFKNDVKKVMSVEDSLGRDRPINAPDSPLSVVIKEKDIITVPNPVNGQFLFVRYQSEHFRINMDNLDHDLDIPDSLVPALKLYVGYRVFSSIGTLDASNKAMEFLNQYVGYCNEMVNIDITGDSIIYQSNFKRNGWV